MRHRLASLSSLFQSFTATIGRRRRNRNKSEPRVPRWRGRKMGQEESSIASGPPQTLSARSLSAVAEYIKSGRGKRIVVLTGAGISTAAGIPDFRSPDTGLYSNLARLNLPYAEAVFDISYFREHPEPFYVLANELYPGKFKPTVSHAFIALLAKKGLLQMLFTQNIDCLERAAGVPSDKIIEAHGSFATQRCIECKTEFPDDKMKEHVFKGQVPRCGEDGCKGLVKPDIVFFGEALPKAFERNTFQASMADIMLVIGTSLTVYPFAGLPEMASPAKPRVLFNMERVGQLGHRTDDVIQLGSCDDGIRKLADELGWRDELENLWRRVVGDEEADRQLQSEKKDLGKDAEDEAEKLAQELATGLRLEDSEEETKAARIARIMDDALGPKLLEKVDQEKQPSKDAEAPVPQTSEPDPLGAKDDIAGAPTAPALTPIPVPIPVESKSNPEEQPEAKVLSETPADEASQTDDNTPKEDKKEA